MALPMIKVITYHYIKPFSKLLPDLKYMKLDYFCRQLDYFEKKYGFISKKSFKQSLSEKKVVEPGVLLTFDDGLLDHFQWVYTELKNRGLWGIFFVSSGPYKTNKLLGVHKVHALLGAFSSDSIFEESMYMINESMIDKEKIDEFDKYLYKDQKNSDSFLNVKRLYNYLLKYEYRDKILNTLIKKFFNEQDLFDSYYMNNDQMRTMYKNGMEFGSHTESHPVLSRLSADLQEREIISSFQYLENEIGLKGLRMFCIPYGGHYSYNNDTIAILHKMKADCAFDFIKNRDVCDDDLKENIYTLPRYDCIHFNI